MLKHHKYYYKLLSGELEAQTAGGNHQSKLIFLLNVFLFLLLSSDGILHVLLLETFYFFREVGHLVLILATSSFLLILSQENTRMPSQTEINILYRRLKYSPVDPVFHRFVRPVSLIHDWVKFLVCGDEK